MDEVKDLNDDLILLSTRLQAIIGIMEEKEGILILTDEKGNQIIALLDLDQEIIVDTDEDWVDLELNEIVETWENFNEIFGDELTERAKTPMMDSKAMAEEIKENVSLVNRIHEDILELVQILRNDFGQDTPEGMTARLESLNESNDSATKCLEDLESIQDNLHNITDSSKELKTKIQTLKSKIPNSSSGILADFESTIDLDFAPKTILNSEFLRNLTKLKENLDNLKVENLDVLNNLDFVVITVSSINCPLYLSR